MKKLILITLVTSLLISCGSKFSLQKRRYTKGFYFTASHKAKAQVKAESQKHSILNQNEVENIANVQSNPIVKKNKYVEVTEKSSKVAELSIRGVKHRDTKMSKFTALNKKSTRISNEIFFANGFKYGKANTIKQRADDGGINIGLVATLLWIGSIPVILLIAIEIFELSLLWGIIGIIAFGIFLIILCGTAK